MASASTSASVTEAGEGTGTAAFVRDPEPCDGTVGVVLGAGAAALSKASATRSAASPPSSFVDRDAVVRAGSEEAGAGTDALTAEAGSVAGSSTVTDSDSVARVRSPWGGTVAVVGSSCSVRSRPNTLRSKLRMPMGEAFRVSWVR